MRPYGELVDLHTESLIDSIMREYIFISDGAMMVQGSNPFTLGAYLCGVCMFLMSMGFLRVLWLQSKYKLMPDR